MSWLDWLSANFSTAAGAIITAFGLPIALLQARKLYYEAELKGLELKTARRQQAEIQQISTIKELRALLGEKAATADSRRVDLEKSGKVNLRLLRNYIALHSATIITLYVCFAYGLIVGVDNIFAGLLSGSLCLFVMCWSAKELHSLKLQTDSFTAMSDWAHTQSIQHTALNLLAEKARDNNVEPSPVLHDAVVAE